MELPIIKPSSQCLIILLITWTCLDFVLSQTSNYYYQTAALGASNYDIAIGNPMKGLAVNPISASPGVWPSDSVLPPRIHAYKIGLSSILMDNPDVVGIAAAYNWTRIDQALQLARDLRAHAIFRIYLHWPGEPLRIPPFMITAPTNITLVRNPANNEIVPYYGDPIVRKVIREFVMEFGKRYDGDTRLFCIQSGMLGAWGEQHTQGCTYLGTDCAPEFVHAELVQWYTVAFNKTMIQFRKPSRVDAFQQGFGYHDDSYTYATLSGEPNGGVVRNSHFWPTSVSWNTSTSWIHAPNGGEVRPENTFRVFTPTFPAPGEQTQSFLTCTEVTHMTYQLWGRGFARNESPDVVKYPRTDIEYANARFAHARMGYSFMVDRIAAKSSSFTSGAIDVDVTIRQIGVAPFYYALALHAICDGGRVVAATDLNVKALAEYNSVVVATLKSVPATTGCLSSVEFRFASPYLYEDRPIKWSQGTSGTVILKNIPFPPASPSAGPPSPIQTTPTTTAPKSPTSAPTLAPVRRPTLAPVLRPTLAPVLRPTSAPILSGSCNKNCRVYFFWSGTIMTKTIGSKCEQRCVLPGSLASMQRQEWSCGRCN